MSPEERNSVEGYLVAAASTGCVVSLTGRVLLKERGEAGDPP